jgi:hypothetical protein
LECCFRCTERRYTANIVPYLGCAPKSGKKQQ